mmetsp:Transcript_155968/g.287537  ORF Transcript_155968/g.287537 Transcript_155968/m.287537 type:complete len:84 (-) Transcript_155968:67-318(-)
MTSREIFKINPKFQSPPTEGPFNTYRRNSGMVMPETFFVKFTMHHQLLCPKISKNTLILNLQDTLSIKLRTPRALVKMVKNPC